MFKFLRSPWIAECGSAALVFICAAVVGREAATGMSTQQWIGAAVAVLGSISVAVMVHCWKPQPKTAQADRAERFKAFRKPSED